MTQVTRRGIVAGVRRAMGSAHAAAWLLAAGLALSPPAAGAATQREHVLGFSFGGAGAGPGQFRFGSGVRGEAAGVAVDEATGDVYVVDRGNSRVEEFSPVTGSGGVLVGEQFVAAWGWGVADGADEFEVCTASCQAGLAGAGKGQLREAGVVAVDNSPGGTGGVFVGTDPSAKKPDVQRFSAAGEALGRLPVSEEGQLDGVSVDGGGRVWIYRGEEEEAGTIEAFTSAAPVKRLEEDAFSSPIPCPKEGFAADAAGAVFYVGHELLTGGGECPAVVERELSEEGTPAEGALARPVVAGKLVGEEAALEGGVAIGALDREEETGIAVDQSSSASTPLGEDALGDAYVNEGSAVAVFDSTGGLVERFGSGVLEEGQGVAMDSRTGDVFVLDGADNEVEVFQPAEAGAPEVEGLTARNVAAGEVRLSAASIRTGRTPTTSSSTGPRTA